MNDNWEEVAPLESSTIKKGEPHSFSTTAEACMTEASDKQDKRRAEFGRQVNNEARLGRVKFEQWVSLISWSTWCTSGACLA